MKKYKYQKALKALKIKQTSNNRSGIDWDELRREVDRIEEILIEEAGATPELGYGLREIQEKKYNLIRNFQPGS